jgi:phosphomannomutase/phosphoglucomutase
MVEGLIASGVDAVFLPMAPTPVFYYAVKSLGLRAGVMITASHNPPEFNGFKVWAGDNTIHTEEIQSIYRIMQSGDYARGQGVASEADIVTQYVKELAAKTRIAAPVRVVVDGGNGSAGDICLRLLRAVGADVVPLYCDPDPDFPNHHPDPTVLENLRDLIDTVRQEKADLGIGLDGDGDRIGVVDGRGGVLYGDQLLAIYARQVLAAQPGSTVIGEVKCSHLLFRDIEEHGGRPLMWKTGHSLIKSKMKETGAILAGEMSGHMFFADRYYGFDDAVYAAQRLVEVLGANPGRPLGTYLADWPETHNTPEIRMECPDAAKFRVVERAREHFAEHAPPEARVIDVDGIRIDFGDGWGLLRASNTQPVLVLRFEAETERRLQEIRDFFEQPLQRWIEDMRPDPSALQQGE